MEQDNIIPKLFKTTPKQSKEILMNNIHQLPPSMQNSAELDSTSPSILWKLTLNPAVKLELLLISKINP